MLRLRRFGLFLALLIPASASAQNLVALVGHVSPKIKTSVKLGRVTADQPIELSLSVKVDQPLLDRTLASIMAQPAATRQYLTPAQFAQIFDLSDKREAIKSFARGSGLAVSADDDPNSMIVKVSGPASVVERAFGVQLNNYRDAAGRVFHAVETEPLIPVSLAPHLGAVIGLSTAEVLHPHLQRPSAARPAELSGSHGASGGLSPADIKTIYGLSGSLNGSGQSIAIFELDGYNPSDIAAYESEYGLAGLSPTFKSVDGQLNECGANQNQACDSSTYASDSDGMLEVALDIELAVALAPSASNILVYTAPNTNKGVLDAYDKIAVDDSANQVSTSWGESEDAAGNSFMTSENTIFQRLAAQGQSVYAAAGDNGAFDNLSTLSVDDPASQPYVTAVGGTTISGSVTSPSETAWPHGGGGVSSQWSLPSYQDGAPGLASTSSRNLPDVALDADPSASGYDVHVAGGDTPVGGTSCAAPLWAAITALVNQHRAALGYSTPLGFANAAIYQLGQGSSYSSAFNDVTTGSNGHYSAAAGYDDATGWGSFKANAFITDIIGLSAPVAAPFTNVGLSSMTANWVAGGEPPQTVYTAQMSTAPFPNGDSGNVSSTTANTSALFGTGGAGSALAPATTYYFQVQASSNGTNSSFSSLGPSWTLAAAPQSLTVGQVYQSSMTLSFGSGAPVANPAGTVYRVDYWQPTGSTTSFYTTSTNPTLTSLAQGATFTLTVAALNGGGALSACGLLVSTITIAEPVSPPVLMTSTGGAVSLHPPTGVITLTAPAGSLTQAASVTLSLPPCSLSPVASAAGSLTPTSVCVDVNAGGIEPVSNTTLSMGYTVSALNGADPKELVVARFDPVDNVWVPLPSSVDTAGQTVTAATSHWSSFQVMANAPAASVSSAKAFPNPWRVSQGPTSMTFSRLPVGARLRIYTLTGLIVKDFSADSSGLASWDGTNESGRPAASGFYFLLVQGQGGTQTVKLAIQR